MWLRLTWQGRFAQMEKDAAARLAAAELAAKLKQDHAIIVKTKPHHNPEFPDGDANWINSVRLSWHVFNSQADVRTMAEALRTIISGAL